MRVPCRAQSSVESAGVEHWQVEQRNQEDNPRDAPPYPRTWPINNRQICGQFRIALRGYKSELSQWTPFACFIQPNNFCHVFGIQFEIVLAVRPDQALSTIDELSDPITMHVHTDATQMPVTFENVQLL